MAKTYDLTEWVSGFEKDNGVFDYNADSLLSNSKSLLPGRFYILHYKAQTNKPYNARPVIISLGISKKEPDHFLCIDLSLIPRTMRIRFIQTIFDMFDKQISDNMNRFWDVDQADNQKQIINMSYELLDKMPMFKPFKGAVKKYKIENVYKIYSVPFSKVYKIVGDFADKNFYVNSNLKVEQMNFLKKAQDNR